MRILAFSDLHLGHPGWDGFGDKVLELAVGMARDHRPDIVLFGGDLCEPGGTVHLEDALYRLSKVTPGHILWVIGNNDLEHLTNRGLSLLEYPQILQTIASPFGIRVLDHTNFYFNEYAFVGGFGGWDYSLWRPPVKHDPKYPDTFEEFKLRMDQEFKVSGFPVSNEALFSLCQKDLRTHLSQVPGNFKMILTTHTVPTPEFLLYGHSPDFDFQNAFMGWDSSESPLHLDQNLVAQFCGHIHRSTGIKRPGFPDLINLSGKNQPRL
ncbi:MAG: metallophosphoesterase, partial [Bacteroidota bacterium]